MKKLFLAIAISILLPSSVLAAEQSFVGVPKTRKQLLSCEEVVSKYSKKVYKKGDKFLQRMYLNYALCRKAEPVKKTLFLVPLPVKTPIQIAAEEQLNQEAANMLLYGNPLGPAITKIKNDVTDLHGQVNDVKEKIGQIQGQVTELKNNPTTTPDLVPPVTPVDPATLPQFDGDVIYYATSTQMFSAITTGTHPFYLVVGFKVKNASSYAIKCNDAFYTKDGGAVAFSTENNFLFKDGDQNSRGELSVSMIEKGKTYDCTAWIVDPAFSGIDVPHNPIHYVKDSEGNVVHKDFSFTVPE